MPLHKQWNAWAIVLVIAISMSINSGSSVECRRRYKYCKIDHLMECFLEPMSYSTHQPNSTGIGYNDEQFEQYCFNMHDFFPYCTKQWLKKCATSLHTEIAEQILLNWFKQTMNAYCDQNGPIRKTMLKHANCINRKVKLSPKYRDTCIWQFQANYEFIQQKSAKEKNLVNLLRGICCTHSQWQSCIQSQIEAECGKEAADIFPALVGSLMMGSFPQICPKSVYNENNTAICDPLIYQAPKNFQPRGIQSDSYLSYLFSYSCSNVGFGFDEERDKASVAAYQLYRQNSV